jgi:hypothetical protein
MTAPAAQTTICLVRRRSEEEEEAQRPLRLRGDVFCSQPGVLGTGAGDGRGRLQGPEAEQGWHISHWIIQ